eukprot:12251562-Alexandrium_andersonii.AAC.1
MDPAGGALEEEAAPGAAGALASARASCQPRRWHGGICERGHRRRGALGRKQDAGIRGEECFRRAHYEL